MRHKVLIVLVALLFLPQPAHASKNFTVGGDRPVVVQVPNNLTKPAPLLIMLHSASTSGAHQERYMKLGPVAAAKGMLYIAPDGTFNSVGKRTWNASKACCQGPESTVDDVKYIQSLIDEISRKALVDRSRIILVGHSNGAFMALKFACTTGHAAVVISLAGALDKDFSCTKSFAFLDIHGTEDATIKINGGVMNSHPYTSAAHTLRTIADLAACKGAVKKTIDFDPSIKGRETKEERFTQCAAPVLFWEIRGGTHSPRLPSDFAERTLSFALGAVD
jgi:polyhydroxybutyrate depolymerase